MKPPAKASKAAAKPKPPLVLTMERERETVGTQRFEEEAPKDERLVGYLYVKKAGDTKMGKPQRVEVTITPLA